MKNVSFINGKIDTYYYEFNCKKVIKDLFKEKNQLKFVSIPYFSMLAEF